MEIRDLIEKELRTKGELRVARLVKLTGVSRAYINRILQEFQRKGTIRLVGKANRARYLPANSAALDQALASELSFHRLLHNENLQEDLILREIGTTTGIFRSIPENIRRIVEYGFTEMLNNAIDHSASDIITVRMNRTETALQFIVSDRGVGIFNRIMQTRNLSSEHEAIQDLLKGKQTTLPEAHSGEGIFFTSKVADSLEIRSSRTKLVFDARANDVFIGHAKSRKGTQVGFRIDLDSQRTLQAVFNRFTDKDKTFNKTEIIVRLYKADPGYVSRSQARRIFAGLDRFQTIVLDFSDVELVGQGFIDEIFRIWQRDHPDKQIKACNASPQVQFMINHITNETT
jgi:anti-sigma regulatory factor (Ser/Thr protein kinase)